MNLSQGGLRRESRKGVMSQGEVCPSSGGARQRHRGRADVADDAAQAQDMAARIAQWMAQTEQSSADSRATAAQVQALSQMAQGLRTSVARFKLHQEAP